MKVARDCEIFYADKNLQEIDGIIGAFFDDICHSKISPQESVRVCLMKVTRDCEIFYADKNLQEIDGIIGGFFELSFKP